MADKILAGFSDTFPFSLNGDRSPRHIRESLSPPGHWLLGLGGTHHTGVSIEAGLFTGLNTCSMTRIYQRPPSSRPTNSCRRNGHRYHSAGNRRVSPRPELRTRVQSSLPVSTYSADIGAVTGGGFYFSIVPKAFN
jgi:hypothetical protein